MSNNWDAKSSLARSLPKSITSQFANGKPTEAQVKALILSMATWKNASGQFVLNPRVSNGTLFDNSNEPGFFNLSPTEQANIFNRWLQEVQKN